MFAWMVGYQDELRREECLSKQSYIFGELDVYNMGEG